jgi:predicted RNase H-like HicB family nuclease
MKLYEREMVHRVYRALNDVPGANIGGGRQSATVKGVVTFGNDIGEVRRMLSDALLVLMDGSIHDTERRGLFEQAMKPVDEYIAERRAKDWA